ncbi:MAG: Spy/CpxP family protein refolding chaperone [Brevundimonas sp.]|jgi:Spy/CpxP family protein refolding chaperone|uniref:Spy/CpxP family protein refolding chaperone n=1 Tax=Brevundimonas sp. TaxID=1871086 RepID=UPI0039E52391
MSDWRSTLVTAILAALVGAACAWGVLTLNGREASAPSLHQVVHDQMDLTPAQDRRLDEIETRFAVERARLQAEVRTANRELSDAIAQSQGDTPQVQAAVDHFHSAMGELQKATIAHVFEMRAVLTPEQAEVFDRAVVDTLQSDAG